MNKLSDIMHYVLCTFIKNVNLCSLLLLILIVKTENLPKCNYCVNESYRMGINKTDRKVEEFY